MNYEVELKFKLNGQEIESCLKRLGATEVSLACHVDRYFNHPARDFRQTDEAFRIRSVGNQNCLTYKGAVQGDVAKTRQEIEISVAEGNESVKQLIEMVTLLGFRFVREVKKQRRTFKLTQGVHNFELAMDDVPPLGHYLEIELLADSANQHVAEAAVWQLAHSLGLTIAEPRSYLDQLITMDMTPC